LCNPRRIFLLDLQMKSEVSDSYDRMFFNFLCECFRYCLVMHSVGTLQASGFGDESLVDWFSCFSGIMNVHFTV
jgi:hypothetical protein